jgi:drug/metabolite transporter (DMT)-like permease
VAATPEALAILSALLFGAALVLTRRGLATLRALDGARVSIPTTAVLLWCLAPFWLDAAGASPVALGVFAAIGTFFPAAVTLLVFESNRRIGPSITAAVSGTTPVFAMLGAVAWLGEALTPPVLLGAAAVIAGTALVASDGRERPAWARAVLLLPLAAAALRGIAQAGVRVGLDLWPSPFAATLVGYTASAASVLAVGRGPRERAGARERDRRGVVWFVLAGVCNGSAVLAMYAALARGRVSVVSSIVAAHPLAALALGAVFLRDEALGPRLVFGVALTVAGVVLVLR